MFRVVANGKAITHTITSIREAMEVAQDYAKEHGVVTQVVRDTNAEQKKRFFDAAEAVTSSVTAKQADKYIQTAKDVLARQTTKARREAAAEVVAALEAL